MPIKNFFNPCIFCFKICCHTKKDYTSSDDGSYLWTSSDRSKEDSIPLPPNTTQVQVQWAKDQFIFKIQKVFGFEECLEMMKLSELGKFQDSVFAKKLFEKLLNPVSGASLLKGDFINPIDDLTLNQAENPYWTILPNIWAEPSNSRKFKLVGIAKNFKVTRVPKSSKKSKTKKDKNKTALSQRSIEPKRDTILIEKAGQAHVSQSCLTVLMYFGPLSKKDHENKEPDPSDDKNTLTIVFTNNSNPKEKRKVKLSPGTLLVYDQKLLTQCKNFKNKKDLLVVKTYVMFAPMGDCSDGRSRRKSGNSDDSLSENSDRSLHVLPDWDPSVVFLN